jgi:hypothetical protein
MLVAIRIADFQYRDVVRVGINLLPILPVANLNTALRRAITAYPVNMSPTATTQSNPMALGFPS